ncbi:MAG: hypothetical protein AMQ22_00881 [Candidatus Methanofastidiosum methylothiophilum]|uniref:Uncharacterized protein n=1 Tax=Candidatus Methanofastidiosum methylothiophilum TaxID=1705564 RepID=A0A150J501_9EURY|nr:MAG: hypothetical protein AMQ22_00881 [Candidatus Methanofastidiosum methylthiophilus]
MLNNKGVMRTFEAIIASVIMILGVTFLISQSGTTYSSNPSWDVINAKNSAEDVLLILEKGRIQNEGELAYYIKNNDRNELNTKLDTLISNSYVYKFNVFELENSIYIQTVGEAVRSNNNPSYLTNGYLIGTLANTKDVWHYHESGGEGNYTLFLPDGGNVTFNLLIVDLDSQVNGYDSVYLNLESDTDFSSYSSKLSSRTPLKIGDSLSFNSVRDGVSYEYTYQISNISIDGNSVSLALISERILVDFISTNSKEVKIFDETFRFNLKDEGIVDVCDIEKKIAEPSQFSGYISNIKNNTWIDLENYRAKLVSVSFNGINGFVILDLIPFKNKSSVLSIESPGEMQTTITAKRIVSIWDSGKVRAFYISLTMGRRKL